MPPGIMAECRERAATMQERPIRRITAAIIVGAWAVSVTLAAWLAYRHFTR
jgi:hypothetical protein